MKKTSNRYWAQVTTAFGCSTELAVSPIFTRLADLNEWLREQKKWGVNSFVRCQERAPVLRINC